MKGVEIDFLEDGFYSRILSFDIKFRYNFRSTVCE